MVTRNASQRGAMLLEVLFASSILAVAAITMIAFATRSLRLLHTLRELRKPACEQLICSQSSTTSTCGCDTASYVIIS